MDSLDLICYIVYLPLPSDEGNVLCDCDVYTDFPKPLVPENNQRSVFDALHSLSHPSITATMKFISAIFWGSDMYRIISAWSRSYIPCQRLKVTRHICAPLGKFSPLGTCFRYVHIDLVRPWPVSRGLSCLLTCINRFSRWPEAISLAEISDESVARAFVSHWIAHFGVRTQITTDRGRLLEASMFRKLSRILGDHHHIRTTSYHPAFNGVVERFHRHLKSPSRASSDHIFGQRLCPSFCLDVVSSPT